MCESCCPSHQLLLLLSLPTQLCWLVSQRLAAAIDHALHILKVMSQLECPLHVMQAAEARSKKQSLMSSGPRKVGGDLSMLKSLTPAQVQPSLASA